MAVTLEVFGIRAGSVGCAAGYEPACTNLISASLFQAGPLWVCLINKNKKD
ncbi:MAG: hypothetical protein ACKVKA_01970 [Rhodobacterales bacterium]